MKCGWDVDSTTSQTEFRREEFVKQRAELGRTRLYRSRRLRNVYRIPSGKEERVVMD